MAFIWLGREKQRHTNTFRDFFGRLRSFLRQRRRRAFNSRSSPPRQGEASSGGLALTEVLICLLVFSIASLALIQALTMGLSHYDRLGRHWQQTIRLWNQAVLFQARPGQGNSLATWQGGPRLQRLLISRGEGSKHPRWEVLRAEGP